MRDADALTWIDFWPFYGLGLLAIIAVVLVFRGLGRPSDDSRNKSGDSGSDFAGRGGRW